MRYVVLAAVLVTSCSSSLDDAPAPDQAGTDSGVTDPSPPVRRDGGSLDAAADGDGGARVKDGAGADAGPQPLTPPPPALVKCLAQKPYVEGSCVPTTVAGWPHPAQACTYSSPIGTLSVTVANPSATQVAFWIANAGDSIPAIGHLKTSDPSSYLRALQTVASALMIQSGRIFPIRGVVGEDQGGGYYPYPFTDGVTTPCPSGEPHCYCRINSLSRGDYCAYRGSLAGAETEAACRTRVGYGGGSTTAWKSECIGNHAASWGTPVNEHIRAQVWVRLRDGGVGATATGSQVVNALASAYGISSSTVASFCN